MATLRIIDRGWIKAQFQFEPRDLWIGLFWRVNRHPNPLPRFLHIYLCVIPLVPFHMTIMLRNRG